MGISYNNADPKETRGWEIVKLLNEGLQNNSDSSRQDKGQALVARQLLAEYFKLGCRKPSRLHSAILGCAVKMAVAYPDFHFVPFLEIWGFEHLRSEDSEARTDDSGRRFPSLVERMTKAYAYSLLYHPNEQLDAAYEQMMKSVLSQKGFVVAEREGHLQLTTPLLATHTFQTEVRGRKMTFVSLLTPDGNELSVEVHTITAHCRLRYDDIPNRLFDVLLRTSEGGKMRVEAAVLSTSAISQCFETTIGYVEHIDTAHKHIHVYDKESRHLVSKFVTSTPLKEGQYVEFVPLIPRESNFKEAIITRVLSAEEGPVAFGYRDAVVTYSDAVKGYCAWELLPDAGGIVHGIVETGAKVQQEPATKGYINQSLCEKLMLPLPEKNARVHVITFLKRGKDGKKHLVVVSFLFRN